MALTFQKDGNPQKGFEVERPLVALRIDQIMFRSYTQQNLTKYSLCEKNKFKMELSWLMKYNLYYISDFVTSPKWLDILNGNLQYSFSQRYKRTTNTCMILRCLLSLNLHGLYVILLLYLMWFIMTVTIPSCDKYLFELCVCLMRINSLMW